MIDAVAFHLVCALHGWHEQQARDLEHGWRLYAIARALGASRLQALRLARRSR